MSTHMISFCGEIRKKYFSDTSSYLELLGVCAFCSLIINYYSRKKTYTKLLNADT